VRFYDLSKLEPRNGLSSPNVRKIVQDHYGFMWFGTQDGLNRFDGVNFFHFNTGLPDRRHNISGSDVYDLLPDSPGSCMWALTAYGGLSRIDLSTCTVGGNYSLQTGKNPAGSLWFKCMEADSTTIFIGTDEGILLAFDKQSACTKILLSGSLRLHRAGAIDKLYLDATGKLWLFISGAGVSIVDPVSRKEEAFLSLGDLGFPLTHGFKFTDVARVKQHLFISSTSGLAVVALKDHRVSTVEMTAFLAGKLIHSDVHALTVSGSRLLISGKQDFVLADFDAATSQKILFSRNVEDRDWLNLSNCVFQSGESIWIGSQYGVAWIKNIHTPFTGYYSSMDDNGTKINHGTTLCKLNDSISIACADDGLYRINEYNGCIDRLASGDFYYEIVKAPGNYLIASSIQKGLQLFDESDHPRQLADVFPELAPIRQDLLISDARLSDSVIFMASQNQRGIYVWNTVDRTLRTINTISSPLRLRSNIINRLFFDSRKQLWIVGDNTVSICNPFKGTIRHLDLQNPGNRQPLSINMDICELKSNYYLTSYGTGIARLDSNYLLSGIYALKEGLNNLGLYKIFPVNDSSVMASSNTGLSLLNTVNGRITNYFEEDGLQSDNFEEASGCVYENYLLFGGIRGYTKIDTKELLAGTSYPTLYFSSTGIQSGDRTLDTFNIHLKHLVIPNTVLQVSIGYTALNYLNPKKIAFRYRIKELNENWIDNANQRSVRLTGLNPGKYTLQLQAANPNGRWNEAGMLELGLEYLPHWYQTTWFKIIMALFAAAIVWFFFMLRLNRLKRQQQIRREIAGDLHDDLGATLNSLKLLTHIAQKEHPAQPQLHKIEESITDAIAGLRDVLWVLDDNADTFYNLLERIKKIVAPIASDNNIDIEWILDERLSDRKMSKKEKKNLLLIAKEAFNNALKHACCTHISFSLGLQNGKTLLVIADNGRGFDTDVRSEGYGLKNIRYRAEHIHYIATLTSQPGKGAVITVVRR